MATIAMLVGQDFEDAELRVPYDRLRAAGHTVEILGTRASVTLHGKQRQESVQTDASIAQREPRHYDALVIPGGYSPDHLRTDRGAVEFVRRFAASGKPIAAICHGPQLLIEADLVASRRVTSWPSVRKDLENAGAIWVDEEVVVDGALITSRKPADLDPFTRAILERVR